MKLAEMSERMHLPPRWRNAPPIEALGDRKKERGEREGRLVKRTAIDGATGGGGGRGHGQSKKRDRWIGARDGGRREPVEPAAAAQSADIVGQRTESGGGGDTLLPERHCVCQGILKPMICVA